DTRDPAKKDTRPGFICHVQGKGTGTRAERGARRFETLDRSSGHDHLRAVVACRLRGRQSDSRAPAKDDNDRVVQRHDLRLPGRSYLAVNHGNEKTRRLLPARGLRSSGSSTTGARVAHVDDAIPAPAINATYCFPSTAYVIGLPLAIVGNRVCHNWAPLRAS